MNTIPDSQLPSGAIPHPPEDDRNLQKIDLIIDTVDQHGVRDPCSQIDGFWVSIVSKNGLHPWPLEWTKILPNEITKIEVERSPHDAGWHRLYIRGPGHLGMPDVLNWSSSVILDAKEDGTIRFTISDCAHADYPAVPPGFVDPFLSDVELQPSVINPKSVFATEFVKGETTLGCVSVTVSVEQKDGTPVSDYLCQIRQSDGSLPLTKVEEIGGGREFKIRASNLKNIVGLWRAGDKQNTYVEKSIRPKKTGHSISVVHNDIDNAPLTRKEHTFKAPDPLIVGGRSVRTAFTRHPIGDKHTSGIARGIHSLLREAAHAEANRVGNPKAGSVRLVAFKGTFSQGGGDTPWFMTESGGWYQWVARTYVADSDSYGELIDKDMFITDILVHWIE
ncbi:MAG: hypothetical protein ABJH63_18575 [Rhizobiaceae bacterium]